MDSNLRTDITDSTTQVRPTLTLLAMIALFLAAMDSTAISTLLPYIKGEFQDQTLYPWLMSGFIVASILITPVTGVISDRIGEKHTMQIALGLFFISSIAIWYAPTIQALIGARILQGIGAGAIMVTTYVIIGKLYTNSERGKMQGFLSLVWGIAAITGPLLGATIQQMWGWQMVFALNAPLCVIIIILIAILYPTKQQVSLGITIDIPILLSFAILLGGILLLIMAPSLHFSAAISRTLIIIVILSLVIQIWRVRKYPKHSLIPVTFLKEKQFAIPALLTVCASIALYASVTLLPLYLNGIQHMNAIESGLIVMASALGWVIGSAICGNLINKTSFRMTAILGGIMLVTGSSILGFFYNDSGNLIFAMAQILIGLGIGFCATTTLVLVQNLSPVTNLGSFTAAIQLCRNLGAVIGINIVTALQIVALRHLEENHISDAFRLSFEHSFLILLCISITALILAIFMPKYVQQKT